MADIFRPPLIHRRPPPELRYYNTQADQNASRALLINPFVQKALDRNREEDKRNRSWFWGSISEEQLTQPFFIEPNSLLRTREEDKRNRAWIWESPNQLLTKPFFVDQASLLRTREEDKRNRSWLWPGLSEEELTAPFTPPPWTLYRQPDRPDVLRAWIWPGLSEEELTPPFVQSIAQERTRDNPYYRYGHFTWSIPEPLVTSTLFLQLPINCVMAGQQTYKDRYRTFELNDPKQRAEIKAKSSQVGRLSGEAPSFKTTTGKKGYD